VLSSGGIPLALALLVRGYRRGSGRTVLAGWLVAAWQLSLGFSLGLQLAYLLLALAVGALLLGWRPPRATLIATLGGGFAFVLVAVLLARPYLEVGRDHPESKRTDATVAAFSGWPRMYLAPPGANTVWSGVTVEQRRRLKFVPEQTLFPGVAVFILALVGLWKGVYSRRLRWGLAAGVLACVWLSMGIHDGAFPWPYEFVYHHLPGWNSSRTPSRLNTLTSLGLALLAAAGATWLVARVRRPRLRVALAVVLVGAVLVEGAGFSFQGGLAGPAHPTVPLEPVGQRGLATPQLHLPMSREGNRRYALWSTAGFPRIVNGRASFQPALTTEIAADVAGFPDARSVARLRELGVRTVVLHPALAAGTSWSAAATKRVGGLGLTRERRGDVIVFMLR
jgi:hypothetical protein